MLGTVSAFDLILCCGIALWAMFSITPCANIELPVLQSILDIGMYLHGFEKHILPDINKRSSPAERWEQAEAWAIG